MVHTFPVPLPAHCGDIMKTLAFRTHTPSSWTMKEAMKGTWLDHMHLTIHV